MWQENLICPRLFIALAAAAVAAATKCIYKAHLTRSLSLALSLSVFLCCSLETALGNSLLSLSRVEFRFRWQIEAKQSETKRVPGGVWGEQRLLWVPLLRLPVDATLDSMLMCECVCVYVCVTVAWRVLEQGFYC